MKRQRVTHLKEMLLILRFKRIHIYVYWIMYFFMRSNYDTHVYKCKFFRDIVKNVLPKLRNKY